MLLFARRIEATSVGIAAVLLVCVLTADCGGFEGRAYCGRDTSRTCWHLGSDSSRCLRAGCDWGRTCAPRHCDASDRETCLAIGRCYWSEDRCQGSNLLPD